MARHWSAYVLNAKTDAGRAIVEQGRRLNEASRTLGAEAYDTLLRETGITPRDARALALVGRKLHPLVAADPALRLPLRVRTLSALADLSQAALAEAAGAGKITPAMTETDAHALRGTKGGPTGPDVIRPTDSWSFSRLRWPRIDGEAGHGYVPGDLYANCLWYYARHGDRVLDPMAGSGMIHHVWLNRAAWSRSTDQGLTVSMADLNPRGPYKDRITQCDLTDDRPQEAADYVIMDPPYCGAVPGQYSDHENDLANMAPEEWEQAMRGVAIQIRSMQLTRGRCTVIVPNRRDVATGERTMFPDIVTRIFCSMGYRLHDKAYASRRSQQRQDRRIALLNNQARTSRVPLADIAEVLTFERQAKNGCEQQREESHTKTREG